jgi:hypothetical protein
VGGRGGGGGGGSTGGGGGGGGSSAASGLSFYAGSGGGGAGGVSSASAANVTFGSDYSEAPRAVISYNVINFTSSPPPTGAVGQRYSYAYATAGDAAVAFKVTAGSLPPGLALSSTGVISGTPTAAGSYTYFVTATGATATQTRFDSITIAAPATTTTPGGNPKTILHTPPPAACVSSAAGLNVSLATTRLAGARVRDAEFFVDNGVARHLKRRVTTHGKPRVVRTTVYLPNATARHLPVSLNIPTSGLASGAHTLTVKLTLISTVKTRHGPKTMATVQTQRTTFAIC